MSADSLRLALGLALCTLVKLFFKRSNKVFSVPPWNTLATNTPPGARTCSANSRANSTKVTIRKWSVAVCPVVELVAGHELDLVEGVVHVKQILEFRVKNRETPACD